MCRPRAIRLKGDTGFILQLTVSANFAFLQLWLLWCNGSWQKSLWLALFSYFWRLNNYLDRRITNLIYSGNAFCYPRSAWNGSLLIPYVTVVIEKLNIIRIKSSCTAFPNCWLRLLRPRTSKILQCHHRIWVLSVADRLVVVLYMRKFGLKLFHLRTGWLGRPVLTTRQGSALRYVRPLRANMTKQNYPLFIQHREACVTYNYKKKDKNFPVLGNLF